MAVILLAMGAGLDFAALKGRLRALAAAALLRSLISPAIYLALALGFGLRGEEAALLALAGGAPAAAVTYAFAADFKAEPGLVAGMITLTVLTSAITLPGFGATSFARMRGRGLAFRAGVSRGPARILISGKPRNQQRAEHRQTQCTFSASTGVFRGMANLAVVMGREPFAQVPGHADIVVQTADALEHIHVMHVHPP